MAVTDQQKIDFLLKKIGFTKTKTGNVSGTGDPGEGSPKQPFAEAIPSPLVVPNSSLWNEADSIPATPPGSDTTQVRVYSIASAVRLTEDNTVSTASQARSWIAYSTFNNSSSARLTNWIDTQFGAGYLIKVYNGDPNSGGTALSAGATNENWFFDYSAGVLNFNDDNCPVGPSDSIYIVGYRYIGKTGAPTSGISTFSFLDLSVERNLDVGVQGGISTFRNNIDANGIIEGIAGQNKIPFLYSNMSDLPSAGTYHGMFAHVHATGRGYFAHAGGWHELVNVETNGNVGTGTQRYLLGSLVSTSTTAVSLNVTGISTFGGNLDINADIDVDGHTNLDNLSVAGVSTFAGTVNTASIVATGIDLNGDIDVDGHTNLDNVSIAGVTTATGDVTLGNNLNIAYNKRIKLNGTNTEIFDDNNLRIDTDGSIIIRKKTGPEVMGLFIPDGAVQLYHDGNFKFETTSSGVNVSGTTTTTGLAVSGVSTFTGAIDANGDLDVDGHTNLDNVSVAGVSTFAGITTVTGNTFFAKQSNVSGISTFGGKIDANGDLNVAGVSTLGGDVALNAGASSLMQLKFHNNLTGFGANDGAAVAYSTNSHGMFFSAFETAGNMIFQTGANHLNNRTLIISNTGVVTLQRNQKNMLVATPNSHVKLYYNDTERLSTSGIGITVTGEADVNGDLDVDGHTNLDNVSIAGFTTITQDLNVDGHTNLDNVSIAGVSTFTGAITANGAIDLNADLDVDGHTNLDNISVSGVSTFAGDATFNGNVSIGGTLTYEDVKNVDSVGLMTARSGINVTGGVITALAAENKIPSLYSAMSNLPNAGTYHGMFAHVHATARGYFAHAGNWMELVNKEVNGVVGTGTETYNIGNLVSTSSTTTSLNVSGVTTTVTLDVNGDLDVDGHTNIDNLSVAGVTTFTGAIDLNSDLDASGTIKGYDYLVAPHGGTTTITVTVESKTSAHRYNGTGSSDGFVFDGFEAPFITLTPGRTYKFDQSHNSNSSHPIRFYLNADRSIDYTDGVTTNGTPGSSGAYTQIVVTDKTPTVLHYQCQNHSYMGNAAQLNSSAVVTTDDAQIYGNLCVKNSGISTFTGQTNIENALSVSGVTTFASNAYFGDNDKIIFGSGNRFQIYDNGTSAIIDNSYGGGSILRLGSGNQVVLGSPLSNNQTLIRGVVNGPAELYHAGAKKLETYSSGINVTGNTVADGLVIDGDSDLNGDLDVDGHTNLDNLDVVGVATFTGSKFDIQSTGESFVTRTGGGAGSIVFVVSGNASEQPLIEFRNGGTGIGDIKKIGNTGIRLRSDTLALRSFSGDEKYLEAIKDGAVELYHNNSKKIETTSSGVTVSGNLLSSGDGNRSISLLDTGHGFSASTLSISNGGRDLDIKAPKDIRLKPTDGENGIVIESNGAVELYHDNVKRFETSSVGVSIPQDLDVDGHTNLDNVSIAGVTTFTGNIDANGDLDVDGHTNLDNVSIAGVSTFTGLIDAEGGIIVDDYLELFHYGGTNFIRPNNGSLDIINPGGGPNIARFIPGNGVELWHTASKKFNTTSTGAVVTGILTVSQDLDVDGHTNLDNVSVAGVSTFADAATFSSTVTHNSTTSLNDDVTFTGASYNVLWDKSDNALEFNDNSKATFGTDVDLTIFHDGSNSFITEGGTGGLFIKSSEIQIQTDGGNKYFTGISNVAKLYHTNNEKLATTSTGINVTGLTDTDTLTTGNATFTGTIIAGGSSGSNGQYLKSTGIGVTWENYPSARTSQSFTASSGQTTFSFSYNVGYLDVFVNGVKLSASEFTATNGTSVVLSVGSFVGDIVELFSYNTIVSGAGGGGISNVVEDTTPQLGGNLELLNNSITGTGNINITGIITATNFVGDGSGLTGITASGSGVVIKNSGSTVGTAGTINFGDNLSVSPASAGIVTITGNAAGITTNSGVVSIANDLDVDGHTNLDNVSVAGVSTFTGNIDANDFIDLTAQARHVFVGTDSNGSGGRLILGCFSSGNTTRNTIAAFEVDGDFRMESDSSRIVLGASGDLNIKHDGTKSFIQNRTGNFEIYANVNDDLAFKAIPNGATELYFDNIKRIQTTAQGIEVTGHSELDNVNIAGVVTATTFKGALQGTSGTFSSNVDITGDLDVNGHTDLDNVSIAGVVTATTFVGALTGNVTGNLTGNVTGNVSGNTSGSSGSCTGNAATATALQNARTIGGVSFDGTTNINLPGVNSAGNQNTSGNAATATEATNFTVIANNNTNETVYPVFVDGATGTQGAETDTGLTYNPSTGNLTATKFTGDGSGLTGITASGSGIVIKHDGSTVGTAGTINFGTNLDVSAISGGAVTVTASGGSGSGISTISGVVNIANDLNVDGHTNLDNVSIAGVTTFTEDVYLRDDKYIYLGNDTPGNDAKIYFDEYNLLVQNNNTSGQTYIRGTTTRLDAGDTSSGFSLGVRCRKVNSGLITEIYGGSTRRILTTNSGVVVTGIMTATSFSGDGSALTGVNANVGITTNLSGTFTASAGSPSTINTFGYGSGDNVVEYTVFIKNGSNFQTQKLLAMRDGTTIHSTQFAVMFSSSLLVQLDATISSGNILLRATPETGVSGSTTYKVKREVM